MARAERVKRTERTIRDKEREGGAEINKPRKPQPPRKPFDKGDSDKKKP